MPLIHRTDGDRWVVVASKGGWPQNPAWFENLMAEPDAEIEVLGDRIPVRASVAEGAERERLWALMTEVWPDYDEYQEQDLAADPRRRAHAPLASLDAACPGPGRQAGPPQVTGRLRIRAPGGGLGRPAAGPPARHTPTAGSVTVVCKSGRGVFLTR